MKRTATVDQKRSKASYAGANPLLPTNRDKQKQRAFDAATEYFKKYKTPLTDTLQSVFGTEFFAQAALWLDPLAPFRNSAGIISGETRTRQVFAFDHIGTITRTEINRTLTNKQDDNPNPVPEYLVSESDPIVSVVSNTNATYWYSEMADSTRNSRSWESSYASGEIYDRNIPSFGTMTMSRVASESYLPFFIDYTSVYRLILKVDGIVTPFYTLEVSRTVVDIGGSCTSPSGPIFNLDLPDLAIQLMNDYVSNMVSEASAAKRSFNLAYQIGELKDLPRLLGDIASLRGLLERYARNPAAFAKRQFQTLGRDIASLNLSWEFGVKSLASAVKGLMDLPERATKRLNYLIERNGKVSTGRAKRTLAGYDFPGDLPTFEFVLPIGVEVSDEEVKRTYDVELRCVVNQTIQFPRIAVPSIRDKDFREQIGLPLSAYDLGFFKDALDLIPFSWLVNWFTGINDYVGIMTAIHSDRQLINYGFMTIVVNEKLTHSANLTVTNVSQIDIIDENTNELTTVSNITSKKVIPFLKVYTRKYQRRVDIGSLDGIKSFGWFQTNLSDFQSKILGSLFSQRIK